MIWKVQSMVACQADVGISYLLKGMCMGVELEAEAVG